MKTDMIEKLYAYWYTFNEIKNYLIERDMNLQSKLTEQFLYDLFIPNIEIVLYDYEMYEK